MKKTLFFTLVCLIFAVPVFAQTLKNPKLETDVNISFNRGYLLIVDHQKNIVPAKFTNTDIETLISDLKEVNISDLREAKETITKQQKQEKEIDELNKINSAQQRKLDEQERNIKELEKSLDALSRTVEDLKRKVK
ncbi:MAG: DUF3450 domain-containing protein [Bacteroidales bacterium]|jgi:TolA-binding protein|nr:DUF3450 domain-containing protein [Bacteroidales bacterium]